MHRPYLRVSSDQTFSWLLVILGSLSDFFVWEWFILWLIKPKHNIRLGFKFTWKNQICLTICFSFFKSPLETSFRSIQNWWQIKKFYCFWFIFQVSIQLNVIHFLQILLVVWLMAKTMCLAVKGTMFLMFVKICVLESTQSKLMTFGHTCHVEPSLLQPWHASQRVLVSDVTWYKPLWHEPWGLPYKYVSQAGMQFSCHLDRNAGAHQKYIE